MTKRRIKITKMKAVKVQYTVSEEYVERNKSNVKAVMKALRENPIEGMRYSTFVLEDNVTFVHINMCTDQETMNKLQEVEAFKVFRTELKESQPISPPKSEGLLLVGASFEI